MVFSIVLPFQLDGATGMGLQANKYRVRVGKGGEGSRES